MSGHSKWSTIKRKKGAADQKRGKIFTKIIHEITVAAREGGGDADGNSRLRLALDKAKAANMPNDTVDRAVKRATGQMEGEQQFEVAYEGYGPGGTAILVETVTNNKNRTVGEVRHAFTRAGGSMGASGCVSYLFTRRGIITVNKDTTDEDKIMEAALEAGALDVNDESDVWEVVTDPNDFNAVRDAIEKVATLNEAEIQLVPNNWVQLNKDDSEKVMRLIEALDDLDDVINVAVNCDFSEE